MPSSSLTDWIAHSCQWLMGVDHITTDPGREAQALDLFAGWELEVRAGGPRSAGDAGAAENPPASHIG